MNIAIQKLAFSAFLGGLLAKSVLDLIKNLFKRVFRAQRPAGQ